MNKPECQTCQDQNLVTCDHRGTGRDADGWCTRCESPADKPGKVNCPECWE